MVGPSYRVAVIGPVGEIAEVRMNGIDCGVVWAPPFQVDVTGAARSGWNEIEITVSNTGANALAADQHIMELAAQSEARYGRQIPDAGSRPSHGDRTVRLTQRSNNPRKLQHGAVTPIPVRKPGLRASQIWPTEY